MSRSTNGLQELLKSSLKSTSALRSPTRPGAVIYCLSEGPRNVTELAHELGVAQPTASRHLKILRDRGLVSTVRQGTTVTYHLADPRLIQALDLLRTVMRDRLAHRAGLMTENEGESA
jgi:ArsR family transcriptional regulator